MLARMGIVIDRLVEPPFFPYRVYGPPLPEPLRRVCPKCFQWLEIVDGAVRPMLLMGSPLFWKGMPEGSTPLSGDEMKECPHE